MKSCLMSLLFSKMEKEEWLINVLKGNIRPDAFKVSVINEFREHGFDLNESDFSEIEFKKDKRGNQGNLFNPQMSQNVFSCKINIDKKYSRLIFKTLGFFERNGVTYKLGATCGSSFKCFIDFTDPITISADEMAQYLALKCGALFNGKITKPPNYNSFEVYFYDELEAFMLMKKHKSVNGNEIQVNLPPHREWSDDVEEAYEEFIKGITDDYIVPEETMDSIKNSIPEFFNVNINVEALLRGGGLTLLEHVI